MLELGWILFIVTVFVAMFFWNEVSLEKKNAKDWAIFAEDTARELRRMKTIVRDIKAKRNREAIQALEDRRFRQRFEALIRSTKNKRKA